MKISIYNKLFLCVVTVLLGILGVTTAQAQFGGVPVWTNRYAGPGNSLNTAVAIAVDGGGNAFVTGGSVVIGGSYDYATIAYSGAGVPIWTNRYNGSGNRDDVAIAAAVDGSGNVFVLGRSDGGGSSFDYAILKYSGAGVALWTNRYNGTGNSADTPYAMAMDGSGDVFVTGYSYGSGGVNSDYVTVAYSGVGVPLWTNQYNGPANNNDSANAMAVDGNGDVFVTGQSMGSVSSFDYATIKYSGWGVALWTNRYNGPGNKDDKASGIAVDGSGNVFVTGQSDGGGSSYDYATIAYSGAGVALWTNRCNGPGNSTDQANMAVDRSGNVFVTGYSSNGSFYDYATIKYSGAGVSLWTNRYNGPGNNTDKTSSIAVDSSGNVFVAGSSVGNGSLNDYATIAYSGAGVALWTNRYNGPGNSSDLTYAMAVDSNGNVFVAGFSGGINGYDDYATIKYSAIPPSLTVNRTTTNTVVISWPTNQVGFRLQSTTNLISPAVWNTNLPSPVVINGQNTVTNPISGTQQFFRLKQ